MQISFHGVTKLLHFTVKYHYPGNILCVYLTFLICKTAPPNLVLEQTIWDLKESNCSTSLAPTVMLLFACSCLNIYHMESSLSQTTTKMPNAKIKLQWYKIEL